MTAFTSVEHREAAVLQVAEHSGGFPVQVLEAGRDVLIHREPADLLHGLVLPQQVGLHRHRHGARSADTANRTEEKQIADRKRTFRGLSD